MSKPVKVYILMGQSNMLEYINVNDKTKNTLHHYPYLMDAAGNWTVRHDVRNVEVSGSGGPDAEFDIRKNDWLTVARSDKIGVEIGIGHYMGVLHKEPVLILKSAIGGRSLGWDLLPPGSPAYNFTNPRTHKKFVYAGHGQSPQHWKLGTQPKPIHWQAGLQYDGDVARAKRVLSELGKYYPHATNYSISGFFWWQGDKDLRDVGHAKRYERNLVQLIKMLRKDFDAPTANFVCATLGQTDKNNATGTEKDVIDAQLAISDPRKHPEFKGSVATVYTHPLSRKGDSGVHYGGDPITYMGVGEAMGRAMVELIKDNEF